MPRPTIKDIQPRTIVVHRFSRTGKVTIVGENFREDAEVTLLPNGPGHAEGVCVVSENMIEIDGFWMAHEGAYALGVVVQNNPAEMRADDTSLTFSIPVQVKREASSTSKRPIVSSIEPSTLDVETCQWIGNVVLIGKNFSYDAAVELFSEHGHLDAYRVVSDSKIEIESIRFFRVGTYRVGFLVRNHGDHMDADFASDLKGFEVHVRPENEVDERLPF